MAATSKSRLMDLRKLQCAIYNQSWNPTCVRTGNKVLRQRLKGPAIAAYYPPLPMTMKYMRHMMPRFLVFDEEEEDRLDDLELAKARGKGPPKKKRTKEESKKFTRHKSVAK